MYFFVKYHGSHSYKLFFVNFLATVHSRNRKTITKVVFVVELPEVTSPALTENDVTGSHGSDRMRMPVFFPRFVPLLE
jgi:hypothetical protein